MRLALPAGLQSLLQTGMFWVDTKLVAHYASELAGTGEGAREVPLAALAVVGPIAWSATVILTVIAVGTTALVGRRIGEGRVDRARSIAVTSAHLAFGLGLIATLVGWWAGDTLVADLLRLSRHEDSTVLASAAGSYLRWFLLLFPFRALSITLEGALRGAGDTATPMWGGLIANLVNLIADALLIFGLLGLPRLGVEGAGIGIGLASVGEAWFLLHWMSRGRSQRLAISPRAWLRPSWKWARSVVRVSFPALADAIIFHAGFLTYQLAIFHLPESQVASHRVAITLQSAAFMPASGFYAAAASLSGRILGAGDRPLAERAARRTLLFGLLAMTPIVALFLLGAGPLARFFSDGDDTVAPLAATCLRLGACEVPFLLVTESLRGTLRGAGETRSPVLVTVLGTWCVRVPLSWWLAVGWQLGLPGIWITTVIDWIVRAGVLWWLYRRGGWLRRVL